MKSSWFQFGRGGGGGRDGGVGGRGEGTRAGEGGGVAVTTGVAPAKSRQYRPRSRTNSSNSYPSRTRDAYEGSGSSKSSGDTVAASQGMRAEGPFMPTSAKSEEPGVQYDDGETRRATYDHRTPPSAGIGTKWIVRWADLGPAALEDRTNLQEEPEWWSPVANNCSRWGLNPAPQAYPDDDCHDQDDHLHGDRKRVKAETRVRRYAISGYPLDFGSGPMYS